LAGLLSGLTVGVQADGFAANTLTREQMETLVQRTAMAYFYKGSAVQYDASAISWGNRYIAKTMRQTNNRDPEDASDLNAIYTVCSAFPHDVYYSVFGKHVITVPLAAGTAGEYRDSKGVAYTPNDPVYKALEATRNTTSYYTYHAAMAAKAHPEWNLSDPDRDTTTVTDPTDPYADVVYYFGPSMGDDGSVVLTATLQNGATARLYRQTGGSMVVASSVNAAAQDYSGAALTVTDTYTTLGKANTVSVTSGEEGSETVTVYYPVGSYDSESDTVYYYVSDADYTLATENTISTLTRADVERIFAEKARPGDILTVLKAGSTEDDTSASGHAMMYLGDVDGDGVGEIIHSWGSGYNNEARTETSAKTGVTAGTFAAATTQDSYTYSDLGTVPFTYGKDFAYLATSGATKTDYLDGYDNRESNRSWYSSTGGAGKNYDGRSGTAFVGRNGGGSIIIEDWTTRLGWSSTFASTTNKVDTTKAYGNGYFNMKSGTRSSYYPGCDGPASSSVAFQFCILRPLNSSTFTAELSPSAQARQTLPDLGVTKTAEANPFQTVANGDTITYSIELVGNKGRGSYGSGRTTTTAASFNTTIDPTAAYAVNVTETLPTGTEFVSCTGGGTCTGDTVAWNNVSVTDGETKTLTYTVRVTAGRGGKIVSPKGKVVSATDPQGHLSTSEISHLVGGTPLSDSAISPTVTATGTGTEIAAAVYQAAYGVDLQLPATDALIDNLFASDYWSSEGTVSREKFCLRDASELTGDARTLRNMVVQNFIGGRHVICYDENGVRTNLTRLRDFSMEFLRAGDILVYANRSDTTGYFESSGGEYGTYTYVYLGDDTFAYFDENGDYRTVTAPMKTVQYSTTVRYAYSAVLTRAFQQHAFVLLRPTQAVDDLAANGCDLSGMEIVSGEAEMRISYNGEPLSEPVIFPTLMAAINREKAITQEYGQIRQAEYISGLRDDALTPLPVIEIKLLRDAELRTASWIGGNTVLDLNGHTIRVIDKAYLFAFGYDERNYNSSTGKFGSTSQAMMAGDGYIKNGTIVADYLAIYHGNNERLYLQDCAIYARDMGGDCYRTSSTGGILFWGHAFNSSAGAHLYMENCVLGTLGNEKPIMNGHPTGAEYDAGTSGTSSGDASLHVLNNVTIYVPTAFNEGENRHSAWVKDGSKMTVDGTGVMREVTTETATLPVEGATEKEYSVVRFSSGVATIGESKYLTLDAALDAAVAADEPTTVNLTSNVILTGDLTIPEGVTLDPGEFTVRGTVYLEPGSAFGAYAAPAELGENSFGGENYAVFKPDADMAVQQSLTLNDAVVLNAAVADRGYAGYYALLRWTEGGTAKSAVVEGEDRGGLIIFPLVEKKAKNMGDAHTVTIFGVDGEGNAHLARSTTLSIQNYAETVLESHIDWYNDSDAEATGGRFGANLGRTMTAMLQYGAAAQTYFGYATDDLVSANLTDAMTARITAKYGADALAAARSEKVSGATGDRSLFYGTSSILGENMALKFYFRLPASVWTDEALSAVTVKVEYTDHTGVTHTDTFPATDLDRNTSPNFRSHTVNTLVAADIAVPVTVMLLRDGRQIVRAWDSIANYTNRAQAAGMTALADPMLIYGLTARDYFTSVTAPPDVPTAGDNELTIVHFD
ncbi:MAG: DUF11 domain-containing protein, partial [Oscillospiraceae bacterium]|nr:DUF11 domain-containing protein [Oscillospiraceae bacterium]